tara:strand:+ start:3785 stop:4159 length:375 start_codon:yes stop_codon:yes gene_type:complete
MNLSLSVTPLFSNLLTEGGPVFMYTTLVLLIICLALIAKGLLKGDSDGKIQKLISSVSLFALAWGFFGHLMGLISAMDAISATNDIAGPVLAGGIKVGLLSPAFGIFVFLIARLGIIGLILKKK